MNIKIDSEFKSLIPPLSPDEYKGLEESILAEGCRDALVLWGDVLVDGHNRYEICQKHGIEFDTRQMDFDGRDSVIVWICDNQLARRNLDVYDKVLIADKKRDALARIAAKKVGGRPSKADKNSCPVNKTRQDKRENSTDYKIAKAAGTSEDTVRRVRVIEQKASDSVKEKVRKGELSINQAYNSTREKAPDPVKRAREEHEDFVRFKRENTTVNFADIQRDQGSQALVSAALMSDVWGLLDNIEKFAFKHKSEELGCLATASAEDKHLIAERINTSRRILAKIENALIKRKGTNT